LIPVAPVVEPGYNQINNGNNQQGFLPKIFMHRFIP